MNSFIAAFLGMGLVGGALAASVGCGTQTAGTGGSSAGGAAAFGESAVTAAVSHFTQKGFTRITKDPVASQHALAPKVVVWVNDEAATAYRAINPGDAMAKAGPFPVGTIMVKQGIAADGNPDGSATVLAKFASGYAPDTGDWWWGRFDTTGALAEKGKIQYCIDCHVGNGLARTDYLRGTPATNQTP